MATKSTAPPRVTLGARIRALREAKDISQLRLAHLIGWKGMDAGAHICRIETGATDPRLSTLQLIARALQVSLDDLLPN